MIKEAFRSELYVPREEPLEDLLGWVRQQSPEFRLRSLIGPAGIGKSWFLAHLYRQLNDTNHCLVLWMDLGVNALHPRSGRQLPEMASPGGRNEWLDTAVEEAGQCCQIQQLANGPFAERFRAFISALCEKCPPGSVIVLLIDGFDEMSNPSNRDYFQEHIFAGFLGESCTRVVLARRDEYMLTHPYLRWNEETVLLSSLKPEEQVDQLVRRKSILEQALQQANAEEKRAQLRALFPDDIDPKVIYQLESETSTVAATILERITPHASANPLINTCLFSHAAIRVPAGFTATDLSSCVQEIITRAGLKPADAEVLKKIVQLLPEDWTARELRDALSLDVNHPDLERLFGSGVIAHLSGTARYTTDKGIYRLISDYLAQSPKLNGTSLEAAL
ncbi:MAG: ATP-binding protein [Ardenticatenaceae bacterium]|nr:ATP-binding protein [Ardenticatenaceae bacterium]